MYLVISRYEDEPYFRVFSKWNERVEYTIQQTEDLINKLFKKYGA